MANKIHDTCCACGKSGHLARKTPKSGAYVCPLAGEWQTFTRRTEDPKLAWLERELAARGIPSRRNGHSFHAPILEVEVSRLDEACEVLTYEIDQLPDDDPRFEEGGQDGV